MLWACEVHERAVGVREAHVLTCTQARVHTSTCSCVDDMHTRCTRGIRARMTLECVCPRALERMGMSHEHM